VSWLRGLHPPSGSGYLLLITVQIGVFDYVTTVDDVPTPPTSPPCKRRLTDMSGPGRFPMSGERVKRVEDTAPPPFLSSSPRLSSSFPPSSHDLKCPYLYLVNHFVVMFSLPSSRPSSENVTLFSLPSPHQVGPCPRGRMRVAEMKQGGLPSVSCQLVPFLPPQPSPAPPYFIWDSTYAWRPITSPLEHLSFFFLSPPGEGGDKTAGSGVGHHVLGLYQVVLLADSTLGSCLRFLFSPSFPFYGIPLADFFLSISPSSAEEICR